MSKSTAGCRFCGAELRHSFVDLGMSPLCNTNVEPHQLNQMEPFYPLHALLCDQCFLVQLGEFVAPGDIFSDYSYFSSYADSWVQHAKRYAQMMVERHGISSKSMVMEIASNDGYLLQHFVAMQVPVLGIEPAANVAKVAVEKGIPTTVRFFGTDSAGEIVREHGQADLLLGNNVLAHVPKLNDFVAGMKIALKPNGIITMEFPHLMRLMEGNQFDTIYHEHFSYFSFYTVQKVFAANGITLFDVEELPTHGGSLRIFGCHSGERTASARVKELTEREIAKGYTKLETYSAFTERVKETKRKLLDFLVGAKREGKSVAGYGAPGKGNTLLNYCGIREDFLDYTVDRSPHKQGRYTPGTRIPILHPDKIRETRPDYVLLLPWNLKDEIMQQLAYVRVWGGKFVTPIPEVAVYN
jgi:C-methyltransferase C-terminal domain/Putative zinc binding domain/Methyltransferase domain